MTESNIMPYLVCETYGVCPYFKAFFHSKRTYGYTMYVIKKYCSLNEVSSVSEVDITFNPALWF